MGVKKVVEFAGRPDGRPEAFDIKKGAHSNCDQCMLDGTSRMYGYREVVILSAIDSPYKDGIHHHLCFGHLRLFVPNVVIGDPNDGMLCHDLADNSWRET